MSRKTRLDYVFETKNANICEKNISLIIFVKKLFFFRAKKILTVCFFKKLQKELKNDFTR